MKKHPFPAVRCFVLQTVSSFTPYQTKAKPRNTHIQLNKHSERQPYQENRDSQLSLGEHVSVVLESPQPRLLQPKCYIRERKRYVKLPKQTHQQTQKRHLNCRLATYLSDDQCIVIQEFYAKFHGICRQWNVVTDQKIHKIKTNLEIPPTPEKKQIVTFSYFLKR